jgi:hypothetical protein
VDVGITDSNEGVSLKRRRESGDAADDGFDLHQVQAMRNELRKMEKLKDRMVQLEAQNYALKSELKACKKTPSEIKRRNDERVQAVRKIFVAFNTGSVAAVKKVIAECSSLDCSLLTPSLFQQLQGQTAVAQFFTIMLETFPDGLFELSDIELEDSGIVVSKFSFTGTKVSRLPSDILYDKWKDMSLAQLYKQRQMQLLRLQNLGGDTIQQAFLNLRSQTEVPAAQAQVPSGTAASAAPSPPPTPASPSDALVAAVRARATAAIRQAMAVGIPVEVIRERVSATVAEGSLKDIPPALVQEIVDIAMHETSVSAPPTAQARSAETESQDDLYNAADAKFKQTESGKKMLPGIKITGHVITTYDNASQMINRIVFVWNTTSLLGQMFGFSDGDLEVLNEAMMAKGAPAVSTASLGSASSHL